MKDIKLTEDYDLSIVNGDFDIGFSDEQHVELLLLSKQGEWKEHPLVGANLHKAKNGEITRMLDRHIRIQLEADGFDIERLFISEKGIELNGTYEKE